jgi:hypothetical protein
MKEAMELVITPPAGLEIAALDAVNDIREAFASGPVQIGPAIQGAWWYRRFGLQMQGDGPAAAFRDTIGGAGQRFCADPVRLRVSGDAVVLDAVAATDLSSDDAAGLIEILNRHFAADGIAFRAIAPDQWLMDSDKPIDATTFAPELAHARSIETFLPQGSHARRLKQIGNEAQMLFHECEINNAREARGQAPINGLWLWGGARACPAVAPLPGARLFSNRQHVRGLASATGAAVAPLQLGAAEIQHADGTMIIDLFAAFADPQGWTDWLAEHWLAPLKKRGEPVRITLDMPAACASAPLFRIDFWRFLRRASLAARLASAGVDI